METIWDMIVTKEEAISAWKYAMQTVMVAVKPHGKIIGGVGALCGAMRRLGWHMPSFTSFKISNRTIICLDMHVDDSEVACSMLTP